MGKMQYCWFCGCELGVYDKPSYARDTCGKSECVWEEQADARQLYEEASDAFRQDFF